eukprot:scaffold239297_cov33-Tisochrysis_lutea.AAC.4
MDPGALLNKEHPVTDVVVRRPMTEAARDVSWKTGGPLLGVPVAVMPMRRRARSNGHAVLIIFIEAAL